MTKVTPDFSRRRGILLRCLVFLSALGQVAVGDLVRADSVSLPLKVKEATRSVFRIVPRLKTPMEYDRSVFELLEKTADNFGRERLARLKKQSKQQKYISVDFQTYGTAFLLNDNQTIVSARHTWDDIFWTRWQGELTKTRDKEAELNELVTRVVEGKIEFELHNNAGETIFSPQQGDFGTLSFILNYRYFQELQGHEVAVSESQQQFNDKAFDFVVIRLSRPLAGYRPLNLSKSTVFKGKLFNIGFATNFDEQLASETGADGKGSWVSSGSPTDYLSASKAMKLNLASLDQAKEVLGDRMLFTNGEAYSGMSGGPAVDEQGDVVSLVTMGFGSRGKGQVTALPTPKLFRLGITHFPKLFELNSPH